MRHLAIRNLYPEAVTIDDDKAFDKDYNPITLDEKKVDAEEKRLIDDSIYKENRRMKYPSIPDQLDILYHEGYDGWKKVIKKVKDNYPKSS